MTLILHKNLDSLAVEIIIAFLTENSVLSKFWGLLNFFLVFNFWLIINIH